MKKGFCQLINKLDKCLSFNEVELKIVQVELFEFTESIDKLPYQWHLCSNCNKTLRSKGIEYITPEPDHPVLNIIKAELRLRGESTCKELMKLVSVSRGQFAKLLKSSNDIKSRKLSRLGMGKGREILTYYMEPDAG
jgi:hypothetical protein